MFRKAIQIYLSSLNILFVFTVLTSNAFCQVKYVKTISSGTGDGSSWSNASSNLQAMIQATPAGGQVWVQAGTYFPNTKPYSGASPLSTSDPRDVTFHIKDDVTLLGGFAGTETAVNQRNISLNETILSGDIGILGDSSDNAYHVVMLVQTAFQRQDGTLDGFTIKGGNANGTGSVNTILYTSLRNFGGGIYSSFANGTIKNCKIISCASSGGGAIYFSRSIINFELNSVYNNRSSSKGGGIYVSSDQAYSSLTVNQSDFYNNTSSNDGGAFYMNYGTLNIDNCNFYNNISGGIGSGLWGTDITLSINNSHFHDNQSASGALYMYEGIGNISNCSFYNNQGSGISLTNNMNGNMLLENNVFHDNTANNGAALSFNGGKTIIRKNIFFDNVAATRGGAIYFIPNTQPISLTNNYSIVEQNIFINNLTTFISNLNGGFGGAWFSNDGKHNLTNNLFITNQSNRGGAFYGKGSKVKFENNTFYGNSANYDGGAIALFSDIDTLINNVFYNNTKLNNISSDIEQTQPFAYAAFYHNALQGNSIADYPFSTMNSNNLFHLDPLFNDENNFDGIDNLFLTEDDGLNLQSCSPLIDKGMINSDLVEDIIGNLRVQQLSVDIGAYETSYLNTIPNTVNLSGGGNYCIGDSGILMDVVNPESGIIYHLLYEGIETGDTVTLLGANDFGLQTSAGVYTVRAENSSTNCFLDLDTTLTIGIYNLPTVQINVSPSTICEGQSIALTPSGASVYQWSDSSINSGVNFIPTNGDVIILFGTDTNTCSNSDTLVVNALPLPDNQINSNGLTLSSSYNGGMYQWLNCETNQILSDQTNQEFTALENGSYAVIVNNGNCSDTSDCILITQVGLEDLGFGDFSISPNPVVDELLIQFKAINGTMQLFDLQGKLLQQSEFNDDMVMQLNYLDSGMYIIKLDSEIGVFEKRFIKL